MGYKSRGVIVYVKNDPTFKAQLKNIVGKAAAGLGDAVAKKVYTYTAEEIAGLVVSLGWAIWGAGDASAMSEAEKTVATQNPVGHTVADLASGKQIPLQSNDRTRLAQHKSDLAAKTRAQFGKIKPPKEDADEFSTFCESAIAETIDEIDSAVDFDSADTAYGSATARASDLEDGIVQFERVRATGRGRRTKGSVGSVVDTIKGIWYSDGRGSGEGKLAGGQGLAGLGM